MTREVGALLVKVEPAVPVSEARTLVAVAGTSTTVQAISLDLRSTTRSGSIGPCSRAPTPSASSPGCPR